MAFSYTEGSTADRDRVRLEIGDTDSDRVLFQDAELDDNSGSAITGAYVPAIVHGNLLVELAGSDALTDALTLTIFIRT